MNQEVTLEVCCGDLTSVAAARAGGATRIELCTALEVGGLTPSAALVRKAADMGFRSVNVLIRPRRGDFVYTEAEAGIVIDDARRALDAGATGIVFGALFPDGSVDIPLLRKVRTACAGADFTFHRAFDFCRNPEEAIPVLIDEGCTTLLTSGCRPTAMEGIDLITRLVELAGRRMNIMAGSGVNAANVIELADRAGVDLVHASARRRRDSAMKFRNPALTLGGDDEWTIYETSADEVRRIIEELRR